MVNIPASYPEVPDSNHGQCTGYPEAFRDFIQSLQAKAGIVHQNRQLPLPSRSSFAAYSELLRKTSVNKLQINK